MKFLARQVTVALHEIVPWRDVESDAETMPCEFLLGMYFSQEECSGLTYSEIYAQRWEPGRMPSCYLLNIVLK